MDKPVIILKNDVLFVDGQQFDGFALFATRDDGNGQIKSANFMHGQFSNASVNATIDAMTEAVVVFSKKMQGV